VNTLHRIKFRKKGDLLAADLYYAHDGATYVKITPTPIDISDATGVLDGADYFYDWTIDPATNLTSGFSGKIRPKP